MKKTLVVLITLAIAGFALESAHDPGPRGGTASAGSYISTLNPVEQQEFQNSKIAFNEVDSVSGTLEEGKGLGPGFNGNSCVQCHAQPAAGGSSPGLNSPQNPIPNPQIELANIDGASNKVPYFITSAGPVREARFIRNSDGTPDGGVHDLYTISGRTDAAGCNLAQPDFNSNGRANNIIFRIPTPLFGLGLVENTPDSVLQSNLSSTAQLRKSLGIAGRFNVSGNDGTITRFGWKAQNKSLLIFAGEAYNVEQGVTNELFTSERNAKTGCIYNGTPEDNTSGENSDATAFAMFARLLAPPKPTTSSVNQYGNQLFIQVGCALCHSATLTTGSSMYTGTSYVSYHPYSDFAVHHMGSGLSDGVSQGLAGPDEFRTAPLWGVGQRLFFMHDGRSSNLLQAIQSHSSQGSEANAVFNNFKKLTPRQQQDILDFLRTL